MRSTRHAGTSQACGVLACLTFCLAFMGEANTARAQSALIAGGSTLSDSDGVQTIPVTPPGAAPDGAVGGMGDVNLFPKRVVLNDKVRVASIGLYNRAPTAGEYEISLNDMVMGTDGRLVDLASINDAKITSAARPASTFLRWSPHKVVLPANEAQMVRLIARPGPEIGPGEYRSHFLVVSVPPPDEITSLDSPLPNAGGVGVRIIPRFGISIPVIVRVGETTLSVTIANIALMTLSDGSKAISLEIRREGTRSAFGDIIVTAQGAKKPLAQMRGVGVYTEINRRTVQLPLSAATDAKAVSRGVALTVSFTDDDVEPGKVLAKQEFIVP